MIDDLLNLVSDENFTKSPYAVLPQTSEFLGLPTDWKYTSRPAKPMTEFSDFVLNPNKNKPKVHCAKYSKDITNALISQARSHNVTVHGILTGAFAKCVCPVSKDQNSSPDFISHGFSLRSILDLPDVQNSQFPKF